MALVKAPCAVVTPTIKVFSWLLHYCNSAVVMNHNVHSFGDRGWPRGQDPQVENAAIDSNDCEHLRSLGPYGRVACLVGSKLLER